jgi:membrane protein
MSRSSSEAVSSDPTGSGPAERTQGAAPGARTRMRLTVNGDRLADAVAVVVLVPLALVAFVRDRCVQWAAALAYYTLIGLVPLLAALFSFIKAVGLHRGITPFIVSTIGAGSPEVSLQIVHFIDRTNVSAVGILSALGAILAVFGIMGNAELCFNSIWGGIPGRPLLRKVRAFVGVAIAAPLMLLLALAGTALLRRDTALWAFFEQLYLGDALLVVLRLVPYALLWVSFTMLYTVLPNRPVRLGSAILGAAVAGLLWQFAQWGYVTFVIRLVRYSNFYGALWQLPILLAWVYVAWSIILLGAEVCRLHHEEMEMRTTLRPAAPRTPDTARDE